MADPDIRAIHEPVAESRGKDVYRVAMNDALIDPEVMDIDTSAYHRKAGEAILIRAIDDFEVTTVRVVITNGQEVESGSAVKSDDLPGRWVYTTKADTDGGSPLKIEAFASSTTCTYFLCRGQRK